MRCDACGISIVSLASGLLATGGLFLAVVTDFWLYTGEAITGIWINPYNTSETYVVKTVVESHSGLWRACTFVMGKAYICNFQTNFLEWVEGIKKNILKCLGNIFQLRSYILCSL